MQRFEFEMGLLGDGILLGLKVAADADAVEIPIHAERGRDIPVFKPADGKPRLMAHA